MRESRKLEKLRKIEKRMDGNGSVNEHTKKRYSAAIINLFKESFDGLMSSVDVDPKYGHLITFNTDSKSLKLKRIFIMNICLMEQINQI